MSGPRPAGLGARRAAYDILRAVDGGVPFDQALGRVAGALEDADRRLAHELAAGVLRRRTDLDARLQPLVHRGWSSVAPDLRDVLRLGAYQLTALDRIPTHAAVATTVELARSIGGEKGARFANAILRGVGGRAAPPPEGADPAAHLASVHSHPAWLVRRWLARFGAAETAALLEWNNTRPRLVLQPARRTLDEIQRLLWAGGIGAERAPYDGGVAIASTRPADLPGYLEGAFMVQDTAQALVARFAGCPPGATVYDACAAPGGKSIALGRTAGRVVAAELRRPRARRLAENLTRAGSGREHVVLASAAAPPLRAADLVLLDAPCLGTGTLARHPDARWRVGPDGLARLVAEQARLLDAVAAVVRPGGWLVYATCSLEPEENEEQVTGFLTRHPEFRREPVPMPEGLCTAAGDLQLLPHRHATDGAFAARLRRRG